MIKRQIKKDLEKVIEDLTGAVVSPIYLEHPENPEHGDYASNLALTQFAEITSASRRNRSQITNPRGLAEAIVEAYPEVNYLSKLEVAGPGFINFYLDQDWLVGEMQRVIERGPNYGREDVLEDKSYLVEHTSPNPQTTIMLGHLRNNFLGMSVSNIIEFLGAEVTKDCVLNDRGVHLCRALWGYLVFARKEGPSAKEELLEYKDITDSQLNDVVDNVSWRDLLTQWSSNSSGWYIPSDLDLKPDHANLIWYVLGSRAYKSWEKVKKAVDEILLAWEEENVEVRKLWRLILSWSKEGYAETYERIGSVHDWVWRESDHYKTGKRLVEEGLKKGVFRKSEGAVVTNLSEYDLPDTVVVKSDGTALYITQDLALTKLKAERFPSDLYVWVVGAEQKLYFQQLFSVAEQLGLGGKNDFLHLDYALINFKGGKKMSTRRGDVVMADKVLDNLREEAEQIIRNSDSLRLAGKEISEAAESIAVGAAKYSLLKYNRDKTINFDIEESLSLEGNSGPYLQYTYARCKSVLEKNIQRMAAGETSEVSANLTSEVKEAAKELESKFSLGGEETELLRTFYKFPEVVQDAGENYSPNLVCNFLFDLAQKYNVFYNHCPILKAETEELGNLRLAVTTATAQILDNGLRLLGIEALEEM